MRSHASADAMAASKSLARRLAQLIEPSVRSTTQRFGNTMKPLICLSLRLMMMWTASPKRHPIGRRERSPIRLTR